MAISVRITVGKSHQMKTTCPRRGRINIALLLVLLVVLQLQGWWQLMILMKGSESSTSSPADLDLEWLVAHSVMRNKNGTTTKPHPHAGALDTDGSPGLVLDTSWLRLKEATINEDLCPPKNIDDIGIELAGGRKVLDKVHTGLVASKSFLDKAKVEDRKIPTILCMVYTYEGAHDKVRAIANTWGRHCDGFLAASNATDKSIGAINLLHQGPEEYQNMWQKVRSMWAYACDNYLDDFDYFHICGDDVYMVIENLKAFLASDQVKHLLDDGYLDIFARHHFSAHKWATIKPRPLLLGMPIYRNPRAGTYPLGGPGYTLNRQALNFFCQEGLATHLANNTDPREDVFMGAFFSDNGIYTSDTRDEEGAWRLGGHGDAEECFQFNGVRGQVQPTELARKYEGYGYPAGLSGVSTQTYSFHLKNPGKKARLNKVIPDLVYRYHEILYRNDHCPDITIPKTDTSIAVVDRPTGLRLVFLGDSVDRYQYLSLTFYLRWGFWFSDDPSGKKSGAPYMKSFLFHENDGGSWNDYFVNSTGVLSPYEACDCYRPGRKGDYQHNQTCENRFYHDPRYDNYVAFFWVPGYLTAQGHWSPASAFRQSTSASQKTGAAALSFEPFSWQHTEWPALISDYVAKMEPRPKWIYLNAHFWPHHFPLMGPPVAEAAAHSQLKTIWSTATVSNNFKVQKKLGTIDQEMCGFTDFCLNNTWMETNLTPADMYDFFHFKPHVYKIMNKRLLDVLR